MSAATEQPTDPFTYAARRLALQLWLGSMLCFWGIGIQFSRLWWLVNEEQQRWILLCYAWEVPLIGWTGAVMLPYLRLRQLGRRLEARSPSVGRDLARYPAHVAMMGLGTSTFGYLLGAIQVDLLADLPTLEFVKVIVQGPVLGVMFAVAGYLFAERAVRSAAFDLDSQMLLDWQGQPVVQSLYSKIFFITVALTLAAAFPIFLYSFTEAQRQQEQMRGRALQSALGTITNKWDLETGLAEFGPHTYGFVVRRSNNLIVAGVGEGMVLFGDGRRDFAAIQKANRGWFPSRDGEHKVVAFDLHPAALPDGDGAVFVAVSPLSDYGRGLTEAGRTAAIVSACALLVALALVAMLARNIVDPIERLRAAASQMATGDLRVGTVSFSGGDEVAALAKAFDRMAKRVRHDEEQLRAAYRQLQTTQDQLVQAEKLSAVGRLVSGVAHELNNPLSAILHFSEELLAEEERPHRDREALEVIGGQARRSRAIVRDLLSFVRGREQRREVVEVRDLVEPTAQGLRPEADLVGARLEVDLEANLPPLVVDRTGIEQVLTNLILNATQTVAAGGTVRVHARAEAEHCVITVEDNGTGIAPEILPRIFEPFFTTKPQGKGTGLGLSVSLGIVQQHGGTLTGENRDGAADPGARFTLRLPWSPAAGVGDAPRSDGARTAQRRTVDDRPKMLIVDDEGPIRMALKRYFERNGWVVEEADDGDLGLTKLLHSAPECYSAVISDLKMPRLSGIELHDRLKSARPDLFARLVVMTGDAASPIAADLLTRTDRPIVQKPFELEELSRAVNTVLSAEC